MSMPPITYTAPEIVRAGVCSFRQLDHWSRTWLLEPDGNLQGSGVLRQYTLGQVRAAAALSAWSEVSRWNGVAARGHDLRPEIVEHVLQFGLAGRLRHGIIEIDFALVEDPFPALPVRRTADALRYDGPMTTAYTALDEYDPEHADIELTIEEGPTLWWIGRHVPTGEEMVLATGQKGRNKAARKILLGQATESFARQRAAAVLNFIRWFGFAPLYDPQIVAVGRPARGWYGPSLEKKP